MSVTLPLLPWGLAAAFAVVAGVIVAVAVCARRAPRGRGGHR